MIPRPNFVNHSRGNTFKEVCNEKAGLNAEVSSAAGQDWRKWSSQLRNVKISWSIAMDISKIKALHLHFCRCQQQHVEQQLLQSSNILEDL